MATVINETLYRVSYINRISTDIIACSSEKDLIDFVISSEMNGRLVGSVVRLDVYGDKVRTPKMKIKNHPYYLERHKNITIR